MQYFVLKTFLFIAIIMAPSALMVIFKFNSFAPGLLITSLVSSGALIYLNIYVNKTIFIILLTCFLSSFASYAFIHKDIEIIQNQLIAIFLLLFLLIIYYNLYRYEKQKKTFAITIKVSFYIFSFLGVLGSINVLQLGPWEYYGKPVFPFMEPSHFILVYTPVLISYVLISNKISLYISLLCLIYFGLSFPSLTAIIAFLIVAFIFLSSKKIILISVLMIVALSLSLFDPTTAGYFEDRLFNDNNLSRLVYFQGWELALKSLHETSGIGLGFQNIAWAAPTQSSDLIFSIAGKDLNLTDGGFVASKIISEFGLVGIVLVLYFTFISLSAMFMLRKNYFLGKKTYKEKLKLIPLCWCAPVVIELYVRGAGYFTPSFIIFLVSLPFALQLIHSQISSKTANDSYSFV